MTLREDLEKMVAGYAQLGHPAIMERFVLRRGKEFAPGPPVGRQGRERECFKNAADFVSFHRSSGGVYVEGFARRPDLPIAFPFHHAWVNVDGAAMDPTWRGDLSGCEYLGVEIADVWATISAIGQYGVLATGLGINIDFIFRADPALQPIVEEIIGRKIVPHRVLHV